MTHQPDEARDEVLRLAKEAGFDTGRLGLVPKIERLIALARASQAQPEPPAGWERAESVCNWHQEDIDGGYYDTGCGRAFSMLEGSDDSGKWMKFCCYCGKKAVVHPWRDDEADAIDAAIAAAPSPITGEKG